MHISNRPNVIGLIVNLLTIQFEMIQCEIIGFVVVCSYIRNSILKHFFYLNYRI